MEIKPVNIKNKADLIKDLHAYKVIAQMNDYYFKLVKARREFIFHQHPETDEVFLAVEGDFRIELRDRTLQVNEGDLVVIPKGVEHKPVCEELCTIMLIEPKSTVNTGNVQSDLKDTELEWI
jgi:mannose-6-phosphate isomerase-like protein (cupin superfamily)